MMTKIVKVPFKLLAVPCILAAVVAAFLIKTAANLSSYILGPLMLFILGCGIYSAVQKMWTSAGILAVMEAACVAVLFFAAAAEVKLIEIRDWLIEFLHS